MRLYDKYNIIYADPPWRFSSGEPGVFNGVRFNNLERHYRTEGTPYIKSLHVPKIVAEDCALFIWVTDAHLKDAIEVMEAWGFRYVTVAFIWEKVTIGGKTIYNLAPWTMKSYEMCLLGTRGVMTKYKKVNNIYQKVTAVGGNRDGTSSAPYNKKPTEVRDRIELLFGDIPRVELFARERVTGWDSWGLELPKE